MKNATSFPIPLFSNSIRISADTVLDVSAAEGYRIVDTSGGDVNITLPDARSLAAGVRIFFSYFNINTSGNAATLVPPASNTLNGVGTAFTVDASIDNGGVMCWVGGSGEWFATQAGIS